jgi:hypothetical protein
MKKCIKFFWKHLLWPLLFGFICFFSYPIVLDIFSDNIAIEPEKISIEKYTKKQSHLDFIEYNFDIINNKNFSRHGIWTKIYSNKSLCSSISIEPDSINPRKIVSFKNNFMSLETLRIDGTDSEQKRCIWIFLQSIRAKERKPFLLRLEISKNNQSELNEAQIFFKVLDDGSENPLPSFMKGDLAEGRMGFHINPPEIIEDAKYSFISIEKSRILTSDNTLSNQGN